jgi:hypothetical protein
LITANVSGEEEVQILPLSIVAHNLDVFTGMSIFQLQMFFGIFGASFVRTGNLIKNLIKFGNVNLI